MDVDRESSSILTRYRLIWKAKVDSAPFRYVVFVVTLNRSFYPTTTAAAPPLSILFLRFFHPREILTNYVVTDK